MSTAETVAAAVVYAQALAAELGEGWTVEDTANNCRGSAQLSGPQGEQVRAQLGDESWYTRACDRGRVSFLGLIPDGLSQHFRGRLPEITVSTSKPAFVVAKELERRLLDDYRYRLAEARERKQDHDERMAEQAALVDQAAAALAPLGDVDVWDEKSHWHRGSPGKLSVGEYQARVRIELEIDPRYSPPSSLVSQAKAKVEVHRELLPRLLAALASLAEDAPQPAGDGPGGVWVVHRADDDSTEAFEDEWRARQYAGFFEGADVRWLQPMGCSAAGQFFIDTVHGEELSG